MGDFLPAVPNLPPQPVFTEQEVLDLFDRLLPDHYLQPLKDPGPGYELLKAYAAVAARMSEAVARVGTGNFIASAQGGSYATGQVEFYRDNDVFGDVQLLPGTIVATADGYTYQLTSTVTMQGTTPQVANVRSTVRGWLYNKPGPITCADGSTIPGYIDRLVRPLVPVAPAPFAGNFDPTIKVRQLTDVTGGASPMLDGLGYDRGLPRLAGETDEAYRQRLIQLPATVTPTDVLTQIDNILGPRLRALGLSYWYLEGWDLRFQTGWDFPINQVVRTPLTEAERAAGDIEFAPTCTTISNFSENVFAWDYDPVSMPSTTGFAPSGNPLSNRLPTGPWAACLILGVPAEPSLLPTYQSLAANLQAIKPAGIAVYFVLNDTL